MYERASREHRSARTRAVFVSVRTRYSKIFSDNFLESIFSVEKFFRSADAMLELITAGENSSRVPCVRL